MFLAVQYYEQNDIIYLCARIRIVFIKKILFFKVCNYKTTLTLLVAKKEMFLF